MRHTRVSEDRLGASALRRPELGCSATGDRRLGEPERSNSTALRVGFGIRPLLTPSPEPPQPAPGCFPSASPAWATRAGKQKRPRRTAFIRLKSIRDFGAGEGIRTLDPNLGKVVLYP
jgi:hypothetical protein